MDDRTPRHPQRVALIFFGLAILVLVRGQRSSRQVERVTDDASVSTVASPHAPTRPPYDPARWPTTAVGAPPPVVAAITRGAALYAAHCASCHGANLEGQPDWKRTLPDGSLPAPPHDDSGHTWHHGDGELLRIIAKGGTIYMPESKMPGFADVMSDDDMRAVLAFIKASWGTEQVKWQAEITAGEVGPQAAP